jgi:hypothetical protein
MYGEITDLSSTHIDHIGTSENWGMPQKAPLKLSF